LKRILVISDIHGEIELFNKLLHKAQYDPTEDQLILLGDYVDRGPNSRDVVEKVIELKEQGALVLKGNHEDMMVKALTLNEEKSWMHWAVRNGGSQTLQSYGFTESEFVIDESQPFVKPDLNSDILTRHLQFIQNLDTYIEWEEFIFVHAGVKPTVPIEETDSHTLIWIREEFHKDYKGDKTIIFGHTPTKNLNENNTDHSIYFGDNNIIGIDGGAVFGGQLNCLELPSRTTHTIKSNSLVSV
jgi:serine/threonine protein phosphatase 1